MLGSQQMLEEAGKKDPKQRKQTKDQSLKMFFMLNTSLSYVPSNFPFITSLPKKVSCVLAATRFYPCATLDSTSTVMVTRLPSAMTA